jgi:tight adherence protein B
MDSEFPAQARLKKFVDEFPNAVDIITRGVKAGLPLGDCLRVNAAESAEPVRSEFRQIAEAQTMGLSTGEAVERIVERVPIPEASFFAIVINIQQSRRQSCRSLGQFIVGSARPQNDEGEDPGDVGRG